MKGLFEYIFFSFGKLTVYFALLNDSNAEVLQI